MALSIFPAIIIKIYSIGILPLMAGFFIAELWSCFVGLPITERERKRWHSLKESERNFVLLLTSTWKNNSKYYMNIPEIRKRLDQRTASGRHKVDIYLENEKVIGAIEDRLERMGFGINRRLSMLADIAQGKAIVSIRESIVNETTGDSIEKYTEKNTPVSDRVRALDVLNHMAGTYSTDKTSSLIAKDEYKLLSDGMRKELVKFQNTNNRTKKRPLEKTLESPDVEDELSTSADSEK